MSRAVDVAPCAVISHGARARKRDSCAAADGAWSRRGFPDLAPNVEYSPAQRFEC